jgi:Zn-dependent protease with chaperone function
MEDTTATASPGATQTDLQQRALAVLNAFDGSTARTRVSVIYQLGLLLIALAMIVLPAIYLGLIALAGYGVYWHATEHTGLLTLAHSHSRHILAFRFLLYFGPIFAGPILIFFLLKPFLARESVQFESFMLSPSGEPLLFAFLGKVCDLVGAPVPKRVQVNAEVNASASFRRGAWSMFGNDLTLTIGLPLVAGLSARQFAGVLAHEFGHFAQGTAMRVSFVIGAINQWFHRVVFERDEWDEWLVMQSEDDDNRLAIVLYLARFGVWVARGVLWVLMMAGHALSCFMSRQMEFDADSHQARLVGSEVFAATMQRIHLLAFAQEQTRNDLAASWKAGRLPDDLPRYLAYRTSLLPQEVTQKVFAETNKATTGLFHTHPAPAVRVRRAQALAAEGVFRLEEPASVLFKDFGELCKSLTLFHYQQDLELKLTPQNLVATEETMTESSAGAEGSAAIRRYFLAGTIPLRPILFGEQDVRPPADPNQSLNQLVQTRQRMETASAQAQPAGLAWMEADRRLIAAYAAGQLLLVGFKIRAEDFELPAGTREAARQAETQALQEQSRVAPALEAFERYSRSRLVAALQLLQAPEVLATFENAGALRAEVLRLVAVLDVLQVVMPPLLALRKELTAVQLLIANRDSYSDVERVDHRISRVVQAINKILADALPSLARAEFPFPHTAGRLNLAAYAHAEPVNPHPIINAIQQAEAHLERLPALYNRILGRLTVIAEQVESRLVPTGS